MLDEPSLVEHEELRARHERAADREHLLLATPPDAPPELRDRVAHMQRRALIAQADAPEAPEAPDPLERTGLAELSIPALVAAGERDMADFREGARRMADQLPRARHVEIAGAGHLAPLETPGAFRELLLGFLAGDS